jgi:hypothetical protein
METISELFGIKEGETSMYYLKKDFHEILGKLCSELLIVQLRG